MIYIYKKNSRIKLKLQKQKLHTQDFYREFALGSIKTILEITD